LTALTARTAGPRRDTVLLHALLEGVVRAAPSSVGRRGGGDAATGTAVAAVGAPASASGGEQQGTGNGHRTEQPSRFGHDTHYFSLNDMGQATARPVKRAVVISQSFVILRLFVSAAAARKVTT
jgi:hypothetical protein